MPDLLTALSRWRPFRAVVVGDLMLDELVHGEASRLAADAPVPVLRTERIDARPGGAASLAMDLAGLHGRVTAIGVVGRDAEGRRLTEALRRAGIDPVGVVEDASRPTTLKRSLVGLAQGRHPQKMFRIDTESREPLGPDAEDAVLAAFERALAADAEVVCLEDYAKGVCTERVCQGVIERSRAAGVPVVVDPAGQPGFDKYRRATVITPNRTEAETATGLTASDDADLDHNARLARALLGPLDLEAVVLTLDRHGALLMTAGDHAAVAVPTQARTVYDVTGAGDMMAAALAAARANGLGWLDATRFANAAAGLEVEIFGVQPIAFERVHHDLLARAADGRGRGRTLDELRVELAAVRSVGKRVVLTNGCFDVLHAGHASLLERARAFGDYLVVAINSDASVRRLKGPERPVNAAADRAALLGALRAVDAVIVFEEDTPEMLLETLRPDVLVKGGDYTRAQVVGHQIVDAYGGRVELVDLVEGLSTTAILDRVRARSNPA